LKDLGGQVRLDQDGHLRLTEHVDEAGRDEQILCIDSRLGRRVVKAAECGNPTITDAYVA
jgi:hypothetical protein